MDTGKSQTTNLLAKVISQMNDFLKAVTNDINEVCLDSSLEMNDNAQNTTEVAERTKQLAQSLMKLVSSHESAVAESKLDPAMVQITASKQQLNERISAFMSHSQNTVDEQNVKEFCNLNSGRSSTPGCARTDASYKRRESHSTHMQVSRASNTEGPQLRITSQGLWTSPPRVRVPRQPLKRSNVPQPIEERLRNIEEHLNVKSEDVKSSDIYNRLKNLENRLLAIEGTSPEYFSKGGSSTESHQVVTSSLNSKNDSRDFTLQDIDDRIRQLKQDLIVKKRKQDEGISLL